MLNVIDYFKIYYCDERLNKNTNGAFFFVRGIVSFKGPTLLFFAFSGQEKSNIGRVRRELDVGYTARNEMEGAIWHVATVFFLFSACLVSSSNLLTVSEAAPSSARFARSRDIWGWQ